MSSSVDEQLQGICQQLARNDPDLFLVDLGGTPVRDAGAIAIAATLPNNTSLLWLDLSNCGLSNDALVAIINGLQHNSSIEYLDLGENEISDEAAAALSAMLQVNQTLTMLRLHRCQMGDSQIGLLMDGLDSNRCSLTHLWLNDNSIGDSGAEATAEMLKSNRTLTVVYLHYNEIGDEGVKALANAIRLNESLETCYLDGNQCGIEGIRAFETALETNMVLRSLGVSTTIRLPFIAFYTGLNKAGRTCRAAVFTKRFKTGGVPHESSGKELYAVRVTTCIMTSTVEKDRRTFLALNSR